MNVNYIIVEKKIHRKGETLGFLRENNEQLSKDNGSKVNQINHHRTHKRMWRC